MLCFNHSNKDSFSFSENLFTEMSMFDAAFSRYLRLISGFDFAYISVVITDECPKKSRIYMTLFRETYHSVTSRFSAIIPAGN